MNHSMHLDHLTLGVCYYPEHWDKSLWKDDLTRMKEYGIEVIRIAEFAWNKFEPHEGEFTFLSPYDEAPFISMDGTTGSGKACYFGSAFAEDTAKHFIEWEGLHAPLETESFLELSEEIVLAIRGNYFILLNYGEAPVTLPCSVPFTDLITGTCLTSFFSFTVPSSSISTLIEMRSRYSYTFCCSSSSARKYVQLFS